MCGIGQSNLHKSIKFSFHQVLVNSTRIMIMRGIRLITIWLYCTATVLAHVDKKELNHYKLAKRYYNASDYVTAKEILAPWLGAEEPHGLTPYALFYYALSAYNNNEPKLAANTFEKIVTAYPDWEQNDEVWCWLGQLKLEAADYDAGLSCLAQVVDQTLTTHIGSMKIHFLRRLDNLTMLHNIFKRYPEDPYIATVLCEKIAQQPRIHRDFDLWSELTKKFNLQAQAFDPYKELVSLKKDAYNVGVFLPFFIDEVDYEEASSNLFVIALYQGIKAAVTDLAEQGIQINLFAYDTKRNAEITAALLQKEEIKTLDLIIGPLYPATIALVTDFAHKNRINVFNPLSENEDVVGDYPFVFLFQASLATQAKQTAAFTLQDGAMPCNVGIIHGTSPADILQAHTYKQYITHHTGQEVACMLPITPEEAQHIPDTSKQPLQAEESRETAIIADASATLNQLTHIYIASKDELIVAYLLSTLAALQHKPCIIGHAGWLYHSSFTLEHLQQNRLCLVAPDHIAYDKIDIHTFRNRFYDQFGQYPNLYACKGYEMMRFLGHMLAQYGIYFQKQWAASYYQGTIFEGITYGAHNDNQHVPIVQLQKGQFIVLNRTTLPQKIVP